MIEYGSMQEALPDLCRRIQLRGRVVAPRGLVTHELTPVTFALLDPTDALPAGIGRGVNVALAAVEALELIGGVSVPELKIKIAPNIADFMNNGV
ncbi:MAG: hypothetical protein ACRD2A_13185, partial [Vicinamibacterales bacterium]